MDLTTILLFCLISLVIGAVLMLLIQYYAFIRYFNLSEESLEQKAINEKYTLPENILNSIKSNDPESKYPIIALNLIIQFLFHELKNSNRVRKWFYRKLSLELDELIAKTTTGKLFDKLTICDLDLGAQFPEIKCLRVHHADLHEDENHIENLDLVLDLKYKGNFRMSIDADMVLGKKGSLTLRVKHLEGLARLQFTRKPYTHWSLSFLGDPQLELDIESQFQGRQLQSNVTSLIISQIRKAVRRKHTLPNYKLRYKPFFYYSPQDEEHEMEIVPNGRLNVKIAELSRLAIPSQITDVYCTLTMSSVAWVEARQRDDRNVIVLLEIEIHKAKNQQIGIVFKQGENIVQIEAILPNTPALKANLKAGDNLISIEGKSVTTIAQVAKIIKNLSKSVFKLRIERSIPGLIRNDAILEDLDSYEDLGDMNISFVKSSESIQLVSRKGSIEKLTNSPSNSPRKPQILNKIVAKKTISRENSETSPCDEKSVEAVASTGKQQSSPSKSESKDELEHFQQHSTVDCAANSFIRMDDLSSFMLDEKCNYLNVCIYGKCLGENRLLGYINVSINLVLADCSDTHLNQHLKTFPLMPPFTQELKDHPLSALSGFDSNLCFGDILIAFNWQGNSSILLETPPKKPKINKGSTDKLEELDKPENLTKSHNFIRTHFHRATQCDFCGKKIWLKDAVQCRECSMCCHKKCIQKCQDSTVCGPVDCSSVTLSSSKLTSPNQPGFLVTEPRIHVDDDHDDYSESANKTQKDGQSFGGFLAQGLKRVNSANNLAIPGIVSSLSQSSRSLPPSPQHTPRKQSLVNQSTNPFVMVQQRLEAIPDDIKELSNEQIFSLTEPVIAHSHTEDIMDLAKTTSKNLYSEFEADERVEKINTLLSKLRIALDSETSSHATLSQSPISPIDEIKKTSTTTTTQIFKPRNDILLQTRPPNVTTPTEAKRNEHEMARRAILLGKSEERVEALSVIMFHLCTGLQHAQGVAFP